VGKKEFSLDEVGSGQDRVEEKKEARKTQPALARGRGHERFFHPPTLRAPGKGKKRRKTGKKKTAEGGGKGGFCDSGGGLGSKGKKGGENSGDVKGKRKPGTFGCVRTRGKRRGALSLGDRGGGKKKRDRFLIVKKEKIVVDLRGGPPLFCRPPKGGKKSSWNKGKKKKGGKSGPLVEGDPVTPISGEKKAPGRSRGGGGRGGDTLFGKKRILGRTYRHPVVGGGKGYPLLFSQRGPTTRG